MSTWWQAGGYPLIHAVEVEKATESSVWIKGRRKSRFGGYVSFFPTFEEAKAFLQEKADRNVASLRVQLERANGHAGNIRGMKKPEEKQ